MMPFCRTLYDDSKVGSAGKHRATVLHVSGRHRLLCCMHNHIVGGCCVVAS